MSRKEPHIPFQDALETDAPAAESGRQSEEAESEHSEDTSSDRWERKERRVNVRFTLIALAIVGVAAGATHLVHRIQVKRSADTLRSRATQLHTEGNLSQAIRYQRQYVEFVPDQVEPLVTLSGMLEEAADEPKDWLPVFLTNERILRQDPARDALRSRQIKIALRIRRTSDARVHIQHFLDANQDSQDGQAQPPAGELLFLLAMSYELDGKYSEAAENYRACIDAGFDELEWVGRTITVLDAYQFLAEVYRSRLDQPQAAAVVLDEMVHKNPDAFQAYLARATHKLRQGSWDEAKLDVERAAELAPDHPDVVLLEARSTLQRVDISAEAVESVRRQLEKALTAYPQDLRLYIQLAQLEGRSNRPNEAVAVLRRGIAQQSGGAELTWLLADQLISTGDLDGAREEILRLRELGAADVLVDYLEARILKRQGEFLQAKNMLERVRTAAATQPDLAELSGVHLADCHKQMGNYEEQLDAARQVVANAPNSVNAQLMLAEALQKLGRLDDAIEKYGQLRHHPGARFQLAQALIEKTLRQPEDQRDWARVEQAIADAEKLTDDPDAIRLLRFQVLHARGETERAREIAATGEASTPSVAKVWAARIRAALDSGHRDEAEQLLGEAERQVGDGIELRLARAAYWISQPGDEADRALADLETDLPELSAEDEAGFYEGLATMRILRGDQAAARQLWTTLAERQPYHLGAQFNRFLLAMELNDADDAAAALDRLRDIEGTNGPHVTCAEAMQLLLPGQKPQQDAVEQLRRRLQDVERKRPSWFLVPLCFARIDEVQGRLDSAARNYHRAIELGLADPAIVLRTSQLMVAMNELDEAQRLMASFPQNAAPIYRAPRQRIAAQLALRRGDVEGALVQAQATVTDNSSAADYVWLGQFQAALGRREQAEESLRRALEIDPSHADAHVVLVNLLTASNNRERAEQAMRAAREHLPEETAHLPLAACYEALGNADQAAEHYRLALAQEPERLDLIQRTAAFYLRAGRNTDAEPLLERLLQHESAPAGVSTWSRRALASVIAGRDYPHFLEAVQLLDKNIDQGENKDLERLAKARLLALRPEPAHRRVAIQLLSEIDRNGELSAGDQLLLARLRDGFGERTLADEHWNRLLARHGDQPVYLVAYIRRQLGLGLLGDAGRHLSTLEELQPASFATVELKARVGIGEGHTDESLRLLKEYVDTSPADEAERATRMASVAALLDALLQQSAFDDAARQTVRAEVERLYRKLIELRPDDLLAFAAFLGRNGRLAESLDICRRALDSRPPLQVAITATTALRNCGASQERDEDQILRVERWLDEFVDDEPPTAMELLQRAELFDLRGQYDEMQATYRTLLAGSERNVIALNNLAWFLSIREGEHAEAERMINRAIESAGFVPALLDTRGAIQLNQNRVEEAVESFREAVALEDSPTRRFRLARVLFQARDVAGAREQLKLAEQRGLTIAQLHPLEHADYYELVGKLDAR